jgi:uncharacterized protein (DUF2344 family)
VCVSENEIWNQNEEKKEKVSHINNAQSRMKLSISSLQTEVEKKKKMCIMDDGKLNRHFYIYIQLQYSPLWIFDRKTKHEI